MDGLRKVPDNVPNGDMLREYLGKPLTAIPDPFGKYESFAHHNNAMLREFLDRFGFEYEFVSSTELLYRRRVRRRAQAVLRHNQDILDIMLPTLRAERAATYSPILPVSPKSGIVLQVPVTVARCRNRPRVVRGRGRDDHPLDPRRRRKLQWKVDWAMRWVALGVDYEMYGKDLTDSGVQSGKIAKALGGRPPEGLIYEMFLDEKGEKISKSKGNGLSLEQWLTYGSEESLAFFRLSRAQGGEALHIGVIPKAVDEYLADARQLRGAGAGRQEARQPVHHVHVRAARTCRDRTAGDLRPAPQPRRGDGRRASKEQIWRYLGQYVDGATPETYPELDALIDNAMAYNRDYVAPTLNRRKPQGGEGAALKRLDAKLAALPADAERRRYPEYRL
jgi:lysyl-tRNA synthetase class 1